MNHKTPNIGIDQILKNAFGYWNKTLIYQLLYGLLFLSILFSVYIYFADYYGILEQYFTLLSHPTDNITLMQEVNKIAEDPNYAMLQYIQLATLVLLFPLQVGFYKMFRKIDLKEKFGMQDFLSGYTGVNFFIYTSFYLFWFIIFQYTILTLILGVAWIFVTLFSTPLMFFQNKRIFETIRINFKVLTKNFVVIFVGVLVAFFFKLIISFTIIGIPFVMAFGNAMIYAMYQAFLSQNENNS